jgi:hypothetical protein
MNNDDHPYFVVLRGGSHYGPLTMAFINGPTKTIKNKN